MLKLILLLGSLLSLPALAAGTTSSAAQTPSALKPVAPPPAQGAIPKAGSVPAVLVDTGRPDPFKRNPPPEAAAAEAAPPAQGGPGLPRVGPGATLPPIEEPPKVPTLGQSSDGRLFLGVVGNRAIYKSGDTYVYEKLTTE